MAKGDYYFPLFYKRLLTSTIGWKDDEFGAYLRLLIHQFDNGSIPADVNELKRIAPSIKKHWNLISKKFHPDGKGGLINEVMCDVRAEVNEKAERARINGKNGGRPKTHNEPRQNPDKTHLVNSGLRNQNPDESYPIINNKETNIKRDKSLSPDGSETAYSKIEKSVKSITEFIKNNSPGFIQPYVDLWNFFAIKNKMPEVKTINTTRKKKLNVRLKEQQFDFIKILSKANQSEFLLTGGKWFGFDWIIENDSNYVKVLEGSYDKKENNQPKEKNSINERLKAAFTTNGLNQHQ